ncbi:class I SAM-dependent methyltransferase [Patescibacteria group bacterium]|nr:class I SAM-dependent methyltransferase [Patescibacteria group bacterium]
MPKNLKQTYDYIAEGFYVTVKDHNWSDKYLKRFVESLSKNAKILDLGGGPGVDTKKLLKYSTNITAVDLSPEMIKFVKKIAPKAKAMTMDFYKLKFKPNTFDGIFAKACLLHVPKKRLLRVLKSLNNILRTNGKILVLIKAGRGERVVTDNHHLLKTDRFFSFHSQKEFAQYLEKANFTILDTEKVKNPKGHRNWLYYLAQKK